VSLVVCVVPPEPAVIVTVVETLTLPVLTFSDPATPSEGISTVGGKTRAELLLLVNVIGVPAGGAGPLSVTLMLTLDPPFTEPGFTDNAVRVGIGIGVSVAEAAIETPRYPAVTVTVVCVLTEAVTIFRLICFDPASTVTLPGTGNAVLLLESVTTDPPAGATALNWIVSPVCVPPGRLDGAIETELSDGNATGVIATLVVSIAPLYFAVIVAEAAIFTAEASTVRLAVFDPAGTTTLAGTGNAGLLLESVTVTPLADADVGTAALSVTVKVALEPPGTLAGETETEVRAGTTSGAIVTVVDSVAPL